MRRSKNNEIKLVRRVKFSPAQRPDENRSPDLAFSR
jgi:hypothetical protein